MTLEDSLSICEVASGRPFPAAQKQKQQEKNNFKFVLTLDFSFCLLSRQQDEEENHPSGEEAGFLGLQAYRQ